MPKWTGFGDKTIWDWLSLLIVPIMLVGATGVFAMFELQREDSRAESQQKIEKDRAAQAVLQSYLGDMANLILDRRLLTSKPDDPIRRIANSSTLAAVGQLDEERKGILLGFLYHSRLIDIQPIVDLRYANLTGVNLSYSDKSGANMSLTDLTGSTLINTNLSGADLTRAALIGANWNGANLLDANLAYADLRDARSLTAASLCRAKSLYQVFGLAGVLMAEVEKQCPQKLLEPSE